MQDKIFLSIKNHILKMLRPQLNEGSLIRVEEQLVQRKDADRLKRQIVLRNKYRVVHSVILEHDKNLVYVKVKIFISQNRKNF